MRYFFRITQADLAHEAGRDPHVAADNLLQVTTLAAPKRPHNVCYADGDMICFDSLSQQRALDTLTGLIAGHRFAARA